jgi:hypothetical protein
MNFKTKQGLALLDAILSESAWEKHSDSLIFVFDGVDIDYINHMISTEIFGNEVIDEYDELLQDETLLEELEIIQRNFDRHS